MKNIGLEFKKTKNSKIIVVFILIGLIMWGPSYLNAPASFEYLDSLQLTISPGDFFFIQGMMAVSWFIYPASLVIVSLMLMTIETSNKGLLKMKTLPIDLPKINASKFFILLAMALIQIILVIIIYGIVAGIVSIQLDYNFFASSTLVIKMIMVLFLTSIPMISFFWMVTTSIRSKFLSIGINVLSLVPTVVIINTKLWYLYPISYPYYFIVKEYERLTGSFSIPNFELFPWLAVATLFTLLCLLISNYAFSKRSEF